jgi:hypothetical protein
VSFGCYWSYFFNQLWVWPLQAYLASVFGVLTIPNLDRRETLANGTSLVGSKFWWYRDLTIFFWLFRVPMGCVLFSDAFQQFWPQYDQTNGLHGSLGRNMCIFIYLYISILLGANVPPKNERHDGTKAKWYALPGPCESKPFGVLRRNSSSAVDGSWKLLIPSLMFYTVYRCFMDVYGL